MFRHRPEHDHMEQLIDSSYFYPTLLREYDMRGVIGETLSVRDAYWIGRVYGHIVKEEGGVSVVVGRDGRLSSPDLQSTLITGLCEAGVDVYDVGISPTPMLYFAEYILPVNGAIMVTGSHNPPNHNGFKMSLNRKPFFGEAIQTFSQIVKGDLSKGEGRVYIKDISSSYINRLLQDFKTKTEFSIVWDPGNGSTCEILKDLIHKLPGKHVVLNEKIDGAFPSHPPDPSNPANLKELQEAVLNYKYDLGIAFDGDGDRMAAIDGKGRIFNGDQLFLLFASDLLKRQPDATIIADVKTSQGVFDRIAELKGNPLMWKTGHSHIKEKMRDSGALLAGEMSGHYFFKENYYGYDDGIYAAIKLIQILQESGLPLSDLYDSLPQLYSSPEIRIVCPSEQKFQIPLKIKESIKSQGGLYNDIDGIRVQTNEGWWLIRASNTQDVLVARCEGYTQKGLENMMFQLKESLEAEEISFNIN